LFPDENSLVPDVMAKLIDTGTTTTPIEPFKIGRFAPSASGRDSFTVQQASG
jgi:hypothetical protein